MDLQEMSCRISTWIRGKAFGAKKEGLVIGISGGIDSAVVSTLCAETGLATHCISMPINQAADQLSRANEHCVWLKSRYKNVFDYEIDLSETCEIHESALPQDVAACVFARINTRSRMRMVTLYAFAAAKQSLVVGTGNLIEDGAIGFCSKYGDSGVDISPIGDITKTQVRQLAAHLHIPKSIQEAIPTDGLWDDNRSDESQIGSTYPELEWAYAFCIDLGIETLDRFEFLMDNKRLPSLSDKELFTLKNYLQKHEESRHKFIPIPICRLK